MRLKVTTLTNMPSSSNQIDALAATAALMERWNRECYQGSATPIDILKSLCEVSRGSILAAFLELFVESLID